MLETSERERLLDRIGLPPAGRRLVLDAAKFAPVRAVASKGGGNVLTPYQSRKMQRTVETESRHLEFPAAVSLEHDPKVLEYFAQPCRLKFELADADGEIHAVDHTPDFLIITEREIWLEEWKHWKKLEGVARRQPGGISSTPAVVGVLPESSSGWPTVALAIAFTQSATFPSVASRTRCSSRTIWTPPRRPAPSKSP